MIPLLASMLSLLISVAAFRINLRTQRLLIRTDELLLTLLRDPAEREATKSRLRALRRTLPLLRALSFDWLWPVKDHKEEAITR